MDNRDTEIAFLSIYGGIGLISTCVVQAGIILLRNTPSIKLAQVLIIHFTNIGCGLMSLHSLTLIIPGISPLVCMVQMSIGHLGYCFALSSLLLKSWRIHKIYNSGFKRLNLTNSKIVEYLIRINGIVSLYLILISIFSGFQQHFNFQNDGMIGHGKMTEFSYCIASTPYLQTPLILFEILAPFICLYFNCHTRNVTQQFNDSSQTAVAMIGIILMIIMYFPLHMTLRNQEFLVSIHGVLFAVLSVWIIFITSGSKIISHPQLKKHLMILKTFFIPKKISPLLDGEDDEEGNIAQKALGNVQNSDGVLSIDALLDTQFIKENKYEEEWFKSHPDFHVKNSNESIINIPVLIQPKILDITNDIELSLLLQSIATGCKKIQRALSVYGLNENYTSGLKSVHGKQQRQLHVYANNTLGRAIYNSGACAMMVSSENKTPLIIPKKDAGSFCVVYYALNGATNLDCNISVGTIFGIWKKKSAADKEPTLDDILRPGGDMICAGYCMYSSSTELIIGVGRAFGLQRFVLDSSLSEFVLCGQTVVIPDEPRNFYSVNEGNIEAFDKTLKSIIHGYQTSLPLPYTLRYIGSMVADIHRTILYGGVYMYPADAQKDSGKLRVLYECAPMAFLIEHAGGDAITGRFKGKIIRILEIVPKDIHERCPIIVGTPAELEKIKSAYSNKLKNSIKTISKGISNQTIQRHLSKANLKSSVHSKGSESKQSGSFKAIRNESQHSEDSIRDIESGDSLRAATSPTTNNNSMHISIRNIPSINSFTAEMFSMGEMKD
eukprot:gene16556-22604_t